MKTNSKSDLDFVRANLQKLFSFKVEEDYTFQIRKYISEHEIKIAEWLRDQNNYTFVAAMNSGKTYSLIKIAHQHQIKTIILVPLVSIGKQKEKEMLENESIRVLFIHGADARSGIKATTEEEIKYALSGENEINVIICVYDSLDKIINVAEKATLSTYTLIIDEAHNLVTQSDFRYGATYKIKSYTKRFKKVIEVTATPEIVIRNQYKRIKFVKPVIPATNNLNVIKYSSDGELAVANHLLNLKTNGKTVLLYDSVNGLDTIKAALIANGLKEEKVIILNRYVKQSDYYLKIMEEQKIPEGVEYILCTRIISDGVNLFDTDVEQVVMLDVNDIFLKRQFLGRFRSISNLIVFDYVNTNMGERFNIDNFEELYQRGIQHAFVRCNHEETNIKIAGNNSDLTKYHIKDFQLQNRMEFIFYDPLYRGNKKLRVSQGRVLLTLLKQLGRFLILEPTYLKIFYESVCGYKCKVIDFEKLRMPNKFDRETLLTMISSGIDSLRLNDSESIDIFLDHALTLRLGSGNRKDMASDYPWLNKFATKDFLRYDYNMNIDTSKKVITKYTIVLDKALILANKGFSYSFIKAFVKQYIIGKNNEYKRLDNLVKRLEYLSCYQALVDFPEIRTEIELLDIPELNVYKYVNCVTQLINRKELDKKEFKDRLIQIANSIDPKLEITMERSDIVMNSLFNVEQRPDYKGNATGFKIKLSKHTQQSTRNRLLITELKETFHEYGYNISNNEWHRIVYTQLYDCIAGAKFRNRFLDTSRLENLVVRELQ